MICKHMGYWYYLRIIDEVIDSASEKNTSLSGWVYLAAAKFSADFGLKLFKWSNLNHQT